MTYRIQITVDGTVYPIHRDVTTQHPQAVHDALGTRSESELQAVLSGLNVSDWYDNRGAHLGPDNNGLEMFRELSLEITAVGGVTFSVSLLGELESHFLGQTEYGTLDDEGQYEQDDDEIIEHVREQFGREIERLGHAPEIPARLRG